MKPHGVKVLLAVFGIAATLSILYSATTAVAHSPGTTNRAIARWEHAALTHDGADLGGDAKLSAKITKMGDEGWELVCVTNVVKDGSTTKTIFSFKRPKS
jgi:hypothetical protein